ncbi:hypothetical protein Mal52_12320 [Symmachiella dynata]|uniref:Uncharacterized protein n=1 Tax=Symmachiella dynata TaxID=2527995 RepID=A0A517ZJV9_9PLAN|nr:hypothetical protein Mal52_12320 [Symmachiella dynata]
MYRLGSDMPVLGISVVRLLDRVPKRRSTILDRFGLPEMLEMIPRSIPGVDLV